MIAIETLLSFLEDTFQVSTYQDISYNGLQFEGNSKVKTIVTGVDATIPFFRRAVDMKADLAIVHHGLFWKGAEWRKIDRFATEKVNLLSKGRLNLYALHLPLDAHPELGNNVRIAMGVGAVPEGGFGDYLGKKIGLVAHFEKPLPPALFKKIVEKSIGPLAQHLDFGPSRIRRIGIVSGGGWSSYADPLVAAGKIDAILTGEVVHQAVAPCRELGIHLFAAGHYATETFGVKALGERLAEKFGVRHTFIDLPTGL